ncbi:MAG: citrate lyase holo-[acyl-carrier protein] synthase [Bacteroidales bacterium]|jgi:holo-ACP synthase CitX|nr:citrate lyase holo-[acyl-carrier protein] synthase [Bacteroidales bacterium]
MELTLDDLLAGRDERVRHQQELQRRYPGSTLVCLTVIMPGNVKRNSRSLIVAGAALSALVARFGSDILHIETRDLPTGFEAFLLTPLSREEAKRAVCRIENTHPLGRLFDLDVIGQDGAPIPREAVGESPRKCLLCDHDARWCMRNHTHTREEVQARIDQLIEDYVR